MQRNRARLAACPVLGWIRHPRRPHAVGGGVLSAQARRAEVIVVTSLRPDGRQLPPTFVARLSLRASACALDRWELVKTVGRR